MAKGFDRRQVLCGGCAVVVAGCGPHGAVPFPTGETGTSGVDPGGSSAVADAYPCDQVIDPGGAGWTGLSLAEYPDLAEVGGWYGVSVGGAEIVVAQADEGCYVAIERACAHEGVPINYDPVLKRFTCPRHGAVYDLQGEKVSGPQPTGLPVYPCGRDGDTVWVRV